MVLGALNSCEQLGAQHAHETRLIVIQLYVERTENMYVGVVSPHNRTLNTTIPGDMWIQLAKSTIEAQASIDDPAENGDMRRTPQQSSRAVLPAI